MDQILLENLPSAEIKATVITIGNFDGVHLGHQRLIQNVVEDARRENYKSVVITFDPHPVVYFKKDTSFKPICSLEYKEKLIQRLGVDALLYIHFNAELAALGAEEYVQKLLMDKLHTKIIWLGYNFTFAQNRSGNTALLQELARKYKFRTNILEPIGLTEKTISSTKIRDLLAEGNVNEAARFLGRKHILQGAVITGDGKGREWGFPTVNLAVTGGFIPAAGIYSGITQIDGKEYAAAVYIGFRPTFSAVQFRVEAHLLGFIGDLYGQQISIGFLKYLRKDQRFENEKLLREQIDRDCRQVQQDFEEYQVRRKECPVIW